MWAFVIHQTLPSYLKICDMKGKVKMKILGIIMIIAAVLYYAALLVTFYRSGKFFKTFIISAILGVGFFGFVNLLSGLTGVSLAFNGWTVGISASFGLPGVIAMLAVKLFF